MNEPIDTIERDGYVGAVLIDTCSVNPRAEFDHTGSLLVQLSDRDAAPSNTDAADPRYDAVRHAWKNSFRRRQRFAPHEIVERYARAFLNVAAVAWWEDLRGTSRVVCLIDRDGDWADPQAAAESVLGEYTGWCVGDVYGYTVTDPNGAEVGSCWGYYGDAELPYVRQCIADEITSDRAQVHAERVAMFRRLIAR